MELVNFEYVCIPRMGPASRAAPGTDLVFEATGWDLYLPRKNPPKKRLFNGTCIPDTLWTMDTSSLRSGFGMAASFRLPYTLL